MVGIERSSDTAAHWTDAEYTRMFASNSAPRLILVAANGEIVGFVVVRAAGPEWEVENVAVSPGWRQRGIGLLLIQSLIERAQVAAADEIHLEVRASNLAARALYLRSGFHESGLRRGYYENGAEDAVLYRWHRLSAAPSQVQKKSHSDR